MFLARDVTWCVKNGGHGCSWGVLGLLSKLHLTYELTVSSSLSLFHSVLINYSAFKSLVMNLWCSSTGHLNQSSQMAGPL